MVLCYLSGLFISEPGIRSWFYVISLVYLSQNQALAPGSMLSLWFIYLGTRRPLQVLCYLSGFFISEPGVGSWFYVISGFFISEPGVGSWFYVITLVSLSQNQASAPGSMLSLWFLYLRTRRRLLVLCYHSGFFISEPGIGSWFYVITLVSLSQNQASAPGSMLSLCVTLFRPETVSQQSFNNNHANTNVTSCISF